MAHLSRISTSVLVLALNLGLSACSSVAVDSPRGNEGGQGGAGAQPGTSSSTNSAVGGAGGASFAACDGPGQCTLAVPGCCDVCGAPSLSDLVPIGADQVEALHDATCTEPVPCPTCPVAPRDPNLFAYCEAGSCREADLTEEDVSSCSQDSECAIRWGTDCCQPCAGAGGVDALVALNVNSMGTFLNRVCPAETACPKCAPAFPDSAYAICTQGHCGVAYSDIVF